MAEEESEQTYEDDETTVDAPAEEFAAGDAGDGGAEDDGRRLPPARTFKEWLGGAPLSRELALLFGLVLPAMLLCANMWRVHTFTVDDSYISFRYARNLARGLGLVYNAGEHIEGYTNFLWTVMLAGGIKLGVDPDVLSKLMGAASALGALGLTYALSARLAPYRTLPCVATWLLASTVVFTGYAVFGLETIFFVCLILGGTYLFLRETAHILTPYRAGDERGDDGAFPWSGVVFGIAVLTRPEAPMYVGILALFLGRHFFARQNLVRGALFCLLWAPLIAFRHAYYGGWIFPNTASAKTGNLEGQLNAGTAYIQNYINHAGPVIWLALLGIGIAVVKQRRDLLAIAAITFAVLGYVILVGGDWMKYFRFLAPFEPFCFLLVDVGARRAVDRRDPATGVAMALFAVAVGAHRAGMLRGAQDDWLNNEKHFWDKAAGGTAKWMLEHEKPGTLALGDIGYVGWATDYPILDLLGLVDPVISKLPGGYTQKVGAGFTERLFSAKPEYVLVISANNDCQHPSVLGSQVLYRDPRFLQQYRVSGNVTLDGGFRWCIYKKKE
jgi:arabinofuranosyltransferase